MTPELFSDAMNEIGAKYVEEALTYKRPAQRSFWSKLAKRAAMAALVALLALSGFAARNDESRNHVEARCLSGTVRTEKTDDFPLFHFHRHALDDGSDTIFLDEILAAQFHIKF